MGERSKADARVGRVVDFPPRRSGVGNRAAPFDREAARDAWRQFARIRGSRGLSPRKRPSIAWGWWLGFAGLTVWLVWAGTAEDEPAEVPEPASAQPSAAAELTASSSNRSEASQPSSPAQGSGQPTSAAQERRFGDDRALDDGRWDEDADLLGEAEETPQSQPPIAEDEERVGDREVVARVGNPRVPPPGTSPVATEALSKIPRGSSDRPPLGGVAATGLHVDRIAMGAELEQGRCAASHDSYSVDRHGYVNLCFRAVHMRRPEFVRVRWERDGALVRRTWVRIPAAHGWRTRAGLPLKDAFVGQWTVRVMSEDDDVELAAAHFAVEP